VEELVKRPKDYKLGEGSKLQFVTRPSFDMRQVKEISQNYNYLQTTLACEVFNIFFVKDFLQIFGLAFFPKNTFFIKKFKMVFTSESNDGLSDKIHCITRGTNFDFTIG